MPRKRGVAASLLVLLSVFVGCARLPEPPHIYVIGIDCTRSFWSVGLMAERRPVELSRFKVQEVSNRIREGVNKINMLTSETTFIQKTKRESLDFIQEVDKESLHRQIEDAMDMVTVLSNNTADARGRLEIADRIRVILNSLLFTLNKRNYSKVPVKTNPEAKYDEVINKESAARIRTLIARTEDLLDSFSYTVNVPDQPQALKKLGDDIFVITNTLNNRISQLRGERRIDEQWRKRGIYGRMPTLNYALFFKVGTTTSTVFEPSVENLNGSIKRMVEETSKSGFKVFYGSSDYRSFFQRSFREMSNLVNDWGDFDKDVGVKITYIIIGDGKHDPDGKREVSEIYNMDLIAEIKEAICGADPKNAIIAGIPWENIREFHIKFCVPQKRYNTDVLDHWAKVLQGTESGSDEQKLLVHYYMFENLRENDGRLSMPAIERLLD